MRKIFSLLTVLSLFLIISPASAQDLELKDDTIRVSPNAFPLLTFMGEIRDYTALCNDYKISGSTTTLTIRPGVSKPTPFCLLVVSEGSKNSPRQHRFVLMFDKNADPSQQIHDYSTKDLLEERVAYLERMRSGGGDEGKKKESAFGRLKDKFKKPEEPKTPEQPKAPKAKAPQAPKVKTPEAPKAKAPKVEAPTKQVEEQQAESEVAQNEQPAEANENAQQFHTSSASSQNTNNREETTDKDEIQNVPTEQLNARVNLKIKAFYRACELLCAKTDIQNTIKYGMKLFDNDEEVLVETTNGRTNEKSQTKIRQYLSHLSLLNYKKVEMTASSIKFVSKFHLAPDGKWHGTAVIIQDFAGYRDNRQVYRDQTNKTFDIIVNTFEEVKDGQTVTKFDIFLGNISVTNVPS